MKILNSLQVGGPLTLTSEVTNGFYCGGNFSGSYYVSKSLQILGAGPVEGSRNFRASFDKKYAIQTNNGPTYLEDISNPLNPVLLDTINLQSSWGIASHTSMPFFAICATNGLYVYNVSSGKMQLVRVVPVDTIDHGYSLGSIENDGNNFLFCTYANKPYVESFDFTNPYYTRKINKQFLAYNGSFNGAIGLNNDYMFVYDAQCNFYKINKNNLNNEILFKININSGNNSQYNNLNRIYFINNDQFVFACTNFIVADLNGNILDQFIGQNKCNGLIMNKDFFMFVDNNMIYSVQPEVTPNVNGFTSNSLNTSQSQTFNLRNMYRPVSVLGKYKS